MRTEDDLRDALVSLEQHAPHRSQVMPGATVSRLARRRRFRISATIAAGISAAAAAAVVVAMTVPTAVPRVAATGHPSDASLRTAILTAFSSASDDILYTRVWGVNGTTTVPVAETWMWPWLPESGDTVHARTIGPGKEWQPADDTSWTYVQPRTGNTSKASVGLAPGVTSTTPDFIGTAPAKTTDVDYLNHTWWKGETQATVAPQYLESLRGLVAEGHFKLVGYSVLNGERTVELRGVMKPPGDTITTLLWADADTYLPVQEKIVTQDRSKHNSVTELSYQFLTPTLTTEEQLRVPIPAGFRKRATFRAP